MSDELDKVFQAILFDKVPPSWAKAAYLSLKPLGSWLEDLTLRLAFIEDWVENGEPSTYWLSGLYFPQGFMTGVLQTHARKYQLAIDTLSFAYKIFKTDKDGIGKPPTDGVVCWGLFTDGVSFNWNETLLVDSNPGVMNSVMPAIHFLPSVKHAPDKKDYIAPLYKTSVRAGVLSTTGHSTNFVVAIALPSKQDPQYWILKAAALLCGLSD